MKARRGRGLLAALKGRRRPQGQATKRASWKGAAVRLTGSAFWRDLAKCVERDGHHGFWYDYIARPRYCEVRHGRGS